MNTCNSCNKELSNKFALQRHQNTCIQYHLKIQREHYERELKTQREQHEREIQIQREQHEREIQIQREQHEREIQIQREQHEREIQNQQRQLEKFATQLFEIAKQPKQQQITNNNRILHITNHLIPIETDEEIRKMIHTQYTRNVFLGGSESLKDMTVSILKDQETGKYRAVCSDASRSVFYYLDNENNLVKDIGMKNIHKKIQKPLFDATSSHYKQIDRDGSLDDDKLCEIFSDNINFIDNELPNRLKPELQLPVNLSV